MWLALLSSYYKIEDFVDASHSKSFGDGCLYNILVLQVSTLTTFLSFKSARY